MCNQYSQVADQAALAKMFDIDVDNTGNLPSQPGIYPDYSGTIVFRMPDGRRTLARARWGMPTPPNYLKGKNRDPGVTNIRNTKSSHWGRWLGPIEHRCLVPFTAFAEPEVQPDGSRPPAWFAFDETRPLGAFAGIWTPRWTSVRKVKEGPTTNDLYAFLTTEPSADVAPVHPDAMPVILRTAAEFETWLTAPMAEALQLQRPLPDGALKVVRRGGKSDEDVPAAPALLL